MICKQLYVNYKNENDNKMNLKTNFFQNIWNVKLLYCNIVEKLLYFSWFIVIFVILLLKTQNTTVCEISLKNSISTKKMWDFADFSKKLKNL